MADENRVIQLTAAGASALAVVRVEGPDAATFVRERFGKLPAAGDLAYGKWRVGGEVLDDPLVHAVSAGCFDVNLHGGPHLVRTVLADAVAAGFVESPWQPADEVERWLPHARTRAALAMTLAQRDVNPADADPSDLTLARLLVPARVAIVGPANAGKSTLVNKLAARRASLVSDVAGTTRDYVEADTVICDNRLPIVLLDTPGRRDAPGAIESAAIELSEAAIAEADVVILLLDATRPDDRPPLRADLVAWNKIDLAPRDGLTLSAETGLGLAAFEQRVARILKVNLDAPPRPLIWPTLAKRP